MLADKTSSFFKDELKDNKKQQNTFFLTFMTLILQLEQITFQLTNHPKSESKIHSFSCTLSKKREKKKKTNFVSNKIPSNNFFKNDSSINESRFQRDCKSTLIKVELRDPPSRILPLVTLVSRWIGSSGRREERKEERKKERGKTRIYGIFARGEKLGEEGVVCVHVGNNLG